ncbi:MAG: hypothetical protein R3E83_18395 [Burkholderiaceae bacterium]
MYGSHPALPARFTARTRGVGGHALHAGLSLARVRGFGHHDDHRLQLGLGLEALDVSKMRVDFTTTGLSQNFEGSVGYAATYISLTPFIG